LRTDPWRRIGHACTAATAPRRCRIALFRFDRRVASGRAGRRYHRHVVARRGRRPLHLRIDAGRRGDNPARARQIGTAGPARRRCDRRLRLIRPGALGRIRGEGGNRDKSASRRCNCPHPAHRGLHAAVSFRQTLETAISRQMLRRRPKQAPHPKGALGQSGIAASGGWKTSVEGCQPTSGTRPSYCLTGGCYRICHVADGG
jgi:hypothetical protein